MLHDRLGVPHSVARGLIDAGAVRCTGQKPGAGSNPGAGQKRGVGPIRQGDYAHRVAANERYTIESEPGRKYRPVARPRPGKGYAVVHLDRDLLVVEKRPDLLTVPTPLREGEESLVERLLEGERRRGVRRPALFALHRLDRDTSGLLLFARSRRTFEGLQSQFEDRSIERRYVAVVEGTVEQDQGRLVNRLVEDPKSLKMRPARSSREGKQAVTEYEVLERLIGATLLGVRILTGRKNQIRAQMAHVGHPLVGDRRYGRESKRIGRTALHARRLSFIHPATRRRVTFTSSVPRDMKRLVKELREFRRPD